VSGSGGSSVYTGYRRGYSGTDNEWRAIDRDIDMAIFEFAPGSVIVKDKRENLCVGFTGTLPPHLLAEERQRSGRFSIVSSVRTPILDA
jgi:hypothetical protein